MSLICIDGARFFTGRVALHDTPKLDAIAFRFLTMFFNYHALEQGWKNRDCFKITICFVHMMTLQHTSLGLILGPTESWLYSYKVHLKGTSKHHCSSDENFGKQHIVDVVLFCLSGLHL